MPLDSREMDIIEKSAAVIIRRRNNPQLSAPDRDDDIDIDLSRLRRIFRESIEEVRASLTSAIEQQSGGLLTVRRADSALFQGHGGRSLYLAVCDALVNDSCVMELQPDMQLLNYGPNGFHFPATAATPERVLEYRRFIEESQEKSERQAILDAEIKRQIDAFNNRLYGLLKSRIAQHADPDVRARAVEALESGYPLSSLEAMAEACAIAGLEIEQFVASLP